MTMMMLASCGGGEKPATEFEYANEKFADLQMLRYEVKGWDGLSLNQKKLVYYYTQDEVRELVSYAAVRGIDIVPEFDVPGHSYAETQCYPWLSCNDDGRDPICVGKETSLEFCRNVYKEIFDLFPYEYVEIGGDEVNRSAWKTCPRCQQRIKDLELKDEAELQSWFTCTMEKYFNANGKKLIGWDEILEGGVSKSATINWGMS